MGDHRPTDNRWTALRENITERLSKWLPTDAIQLRQAYTEAQKNARNNAQNILKSLSVSDDKLAQILTRVRAELPTTEALLIGKPQAGKSSIVRGLTGVSAEIIGQGFRPHTQHTQRYAYPSEDLPLLIFTDTVGLGDIGQNTDRLVTELAEELRHKGPVSESAVDKADSQALANGEALADDQALVPGRQDGQAARILVLTVKITDFAVDQLRLIAQQLRQQYPNVPCLLAVTCLHEIYPPENENHPSYPPEYSELVRAFEALKASFEGCFDQAVLIDFTLEEDGFEPVFYGQTALSNALADLLPEAEANAIYQLITDQTDVGTELGNLYRDVGRRYISAFSVIAATLAAVPLPFATMPVLTALQVSMVGVLGQLYGQKLTSSQAGGVVSAIAGGFFAQAIGRELIKFIPGFGSVIAASWAAGYTWALGEGACAYFGDLMGGKKPDPERIQRVMEAAFETAKERFRNV
ncbi:MAG: GTPase [Cyanobacteria bacterium P01_D01_bin.105]